MILYSPFIYGKLTHTFPPLLHAQYSGCGDRELKLFECLEAYGNFRGKEVCRDLIEDFYECLRMPKRMQRYKLMNIERERQEKAGLRKREDRIKLPSYLY